MKQTFTKEDVPPYLDNRNDIIKLLDILTIAHDSNEISINQKYQFVCERLATLDENQQIAIGVAEIVLPIYEQQYPHNKAPREAIKAAKDFLLGAIDINNLRIKRAYAEVACAYANIAYLNANTAYNAAHMNNNASANALTFTTSAAASAADAVYYAIYAASRCSIEGFYIPEKAAYKDVAEVASIAAYSAIAAADNETQAALLEFLIKICTPPSQEVTLRDLLHKVKNSSWRNPDL